MKVEREFDPVEKPKHYVWAGIEVIDVIETFGLGFHLGNVVKYVLRAGHKNDRLEDLKKARWYLDRQIRRLEGEGGVDGPVGNKTAGYFLAVEG